jgi:hypothetical protein
MLKKGPSPQDSVNSGDVDGSSSSKNCDSNDEGIKLCGFAMYRVSSNLTVPWVFKPGGEFVLAGTLDISEGWIIIDSAIGQFEGGGVRTTSDIEFCDTEDVGGRSVEESD